MAEFTMSKRQFRTQKLDAFGQLHVSRRIAPILLGMVGVLEGNKTLEQTVQPIVTALADMTDADVEYVVGRCLSVVQTESTPGTWAPIWNARGAVLMFDDIDMATMLQLTAKVIQDSLGNFMDALPGFAQSVKTPAA